MNVSYDGLLDKCITFMCADIDEGVPVKVTSDCTVSAAADGDDFFGVSAVVKNGLCSVKTEGTVTLGYTGDTAPTVGFGYLAADGEGGVSVAASGVRRVIIAVDSTEETVTFII